MSEHRNFQALNEQVDNFVKNNQYYQALSKDFEPLKQQSCQLINDEINRIAAGSSSPKQKGLDIGILTNCQHKIRNCKNN